MNTNEAIKALLFYMKIMASIYTVYIFNNFIIIIIVIFKLKSNFQSSPREATYSNGNDAASRSTASFPQVA
jgi:hypothetical protein